MTSYYWAASQVTALDLALTTCKCIKYDLLYNHFHRKSAVIRWVLGTHFLFDIYELDPALICSEKKIIFWLDVLCQSAPFAHPQLHLFKQLLIILWDSLRRQWKDDCLNIFFSNHYCLSWNLCEVARSCPCLSWFLYPHPITRSTILNVIKWLLYNICYGATEFVFSEAYLISLNISGLRRQLWSEMIFVALGFA